MREPELASVEQIPRPGAIGERTVIGPGFRDQHRFIRGFHEPRRDDGAGSSPTHNQRID